MCAQWCPILLQSHGLYPTRFLCPWNFPGKNTGVSCHFLLQGIFPTQGSNLCLLRWQADSLSLSHQGSPQFCIAFKYLMSELSPTAAATAAKSLQSCPTLCDLIDGRPRGSTVPGFSRQEHWSGLPLPSLMHESEK